jgi:hypothetical protein
LIGYDDHDTVAHDILNEIRIANNNITIAKLAIQQYNTIKDNKNQCIINLKSQHIHQYDRTLKLNLSNKKLNRAFIHNTKEDMNIRSNMLAQQNKITDEIIIINKHIHNNEQIITNETQTLTTLYNKWEQYRGPFITSMELAIDGSGVKRKRYVVQYG